MNFPRQYQVEFRVIYRLFSPRGIMEPFRKLPPSAGLFRLVPDTEHAGTVVELREGLQLKKAPDLHKIDENFADKATIHNRCRHRNSKDPTTFYEEPQVKSERHAASRIPAHQVSPVFMESLESVPKSSDQERFVPSSVVDYGCVVGLARTQVSYCHHPTRLPLQGAFFHFFYPVSDPLFSVGCPRIFDLLL
jgi:hypothetical protein